MTDLPKKTEAKLIEAMISEFWKQGLNHASWCNHMRAALAVAKASIGDEVLEEVAHYVDNQMEVLPMMCDGHERLAENIRAMNSKPTEG